MTVQALSRRLLEQGCNPARYVIGPRGQASDVFCLDHRNGRWRVFYTERGRDEEPVHAGDDEAQACAFFFRLVMSMRHDHCVGFFRCETQARALQGRLQEIGVTAWMDRIPYGGVLDPRFKVFVTGKAIFAARALLGPEQVQDPD